MDIYEDAPNEDVIKYIIYLCIHVYVHEYTETTFTLIVGPLGSLVVFLYFYFLGDQGERLIASLMATR